MIGNWIKLHRQVIESDVFADPHLFHLWTWLLVRAAFKIQHVRMSTGRGTVVVTLLPGQLVTGRGQGATALGIPESTFRNRLEKLKSMGMITIDSDTHWSIVSIVNWLVYQQLDDEERTGIDNEKGQAKDRHNTNDLTVEHDIGESLVDRLRTGKGQAKDTYKNANFQTWSIDHGS